MKKVISMMMVIVMVCVLCVPAMAAETSEHPLPPEYLCDCDNPNLRYEDSYEGVQDMSDEQYHYIYVYNAYKCDICSNYVYMHVRTYAEEHAFNKPDGSCSVCDYPDTFNPDD